MSRCFYALWPDESTRAELTTAVRRVPHHGLPVDPWNFHLTLVFLGGITRVQLEGLIQATSELHSPPFTLNLDRAGWWSGPRVLWLAPSLNPDPLSRLVEGLSDVAKRRDIALDARPYNPHLTIARKVRDFEGTAVFKPVKWRVGGFHLLESKSLKSGVVYEPLAAWPLTAAGPPADL